MKIAFFYPPKGVHKDNKNWMYYLAKKLAKHHTVYDNICPPDMDVIIGMSISMIKKITSAHMAYPDVPLILYNWDMHPLLQPEVGKWDEIGWDVLLKEARDVWTQTQYHADLAEELSGVRHFVMPMGAVDEEMEGIVPKDDGYMLMASRRVPYKGFELFEQACKEMNVPFVSRHPDYDNRDEYLDVLSQCKAVVIASEEEANTPMSGYEGAFLGKPLIVRDIPAFREEWEESATYFSDLDGLKHAITHIDPTMGRKAQERANRYTLEAFSDRIHNRLCEVL